MASRLENLKRELAWSDFGTPKAVGAPTPNQRGSAAYTHCRWKLTRAPQAERVPNQDAVRLRDDVVVTIEFDARKSWVADWVFSQPTSFQNSLLHHERGHYKVCALVARDFFIALMQLKGRTFANAPALGAEINALIAAHHNEQVIQPIHDTYDEPLEADHGLNPAGQTRWDGYFDSAFTTPRTPPMRAPDGTSYKIPLLQVLRNAGKL